VARTLIIAEAGVNHGGSVQTALELVDVAASANADVVKFQTFAVNEIVTSSAPQAAYQRERAPAGSQQDMLRSLALDEAAHETIARRCSELGIEFLSTAFDERSLAMLVELGIRRVKVPSGELTNGPLLLAFARTRLPLIVSTGMASLGEVETALKVIAYGRQTSGGIPAKSDLESAYQRAMGDGNLADEVTVMHCTSSYPARPEDVNLAAMATLGQAFGVPVGYSDHTRGTAIACAAVALGASVIEKHVTLDRTSPGPDHAASLEPGELRALVDGVRAVEASIGSPVKFPTEGERDTALVARRSLYAARPIAAGSVFVMDDLKVLRPGTGRTPMDYWELLGRSAQRDYEAHEPIRMTE
jgi:N-acetylneuraminate synthase